LDAETALAALIVVAVIAYVVTVVHAATTRALARRGEAGRPEEGLLVWPRWLTALVAGLLAMWLLYRVRGILLPFIVGAIIAYLLNPAIDRLERRGWPRTQAIALVFGTFLLIFVIAILMVVPAVASQAQDLSSGYGVYAQEARDLMARAREKAELWGQVVGLVPSQVREAFENVAARAQSYALSLLNEALGMLNRSLVIVSLLIITPVVSFWLLRDYHDLGRQVLRVLPERQRETTLAILRDVNQVAGGYLLGMATMAVIVGAYAVAVLTIAGVPFSVLLGAMTGVLYVIPYVGYPTAVVITGLTMVVTGKNLPFILVVLAIMVAGNVISDYGLYPRVVGRRVGLHPLVVIFALLAGGALFGFMGVVLAVPVAGVIKVLSLYFWPQLYQAEPGLVPSGGQGPGGGS
jgi:predicted PurR-regulated permease PerM